MTLTGDSCFKNNLDYIELLQEMLNTMELDTGASSQL